MENTKNLNLPLLYRGQLNKDITVNTAFLMLDSIINTSLLTLQGYKTPPTNLQQGDLILIADDAEDSFEDFKNHLAFYEQGWYFIKPKEGLILWVKDEKKCVVFINNNFEDINFNTQKIVELEKRISQLETPTQFGINTQKDEVNKLSVKSNYSLFNNENGDVRIILNKQEKENTASFIFQSNWKGVAEFGSIGNNNFVFKIANQNGWQEVFEINSTNGNINFKKDVLKNGNKIF